MPEVIQPDWPAPDCVYAFTTTRKGGVSKSNWLGLNLSMHSGDAPPDVIENRRRLRALLPNPPKWLDQAHGNTVALHDGQTEDLPAADAIVSSTPGQVCAVLTADCLPVLFADAGGKQVAVAHAGWRGLAAGVLEQTVKAMDAAPGDIMAWLGPGIGPDHYRVGNEVRAAFTARNPVASQAFRSARGRWLADLYLLARQCLERAGVDRIYGGGFCTFSDSERFYSVRRTGQSGRMATLIWLGKARV